MAVLRCWAEGCSTTTDTSKRENLRVFKFPSDLERCREWVRRAGNKDLLKIPSNKLSTNRFICALHFHESAFFNKYKNTLHRTALPCEALGEPLPEDVMRKWPVSDKNFFECLESEGTPIITGESSETLRANKRLASSLDDGVCQKLPRNDLPVFSLEQTSVVETQDAIVMVPEVEHPEPLLPSTPRQPLNRTITRITKKGIAREAGITQLTPKKAALVNIAQGHYQKALIVKRKLTYMTQKAARLEDIIKNSSSSSVQVNNMQISQAAKHILEGEIRNFDRPLTSRSWSLKEKCFYLSVYNRSPKTYRFLKKNMVVPCEKTIKNVLKNVKLEPGISKFLMTALQKKTDGLSEKERCCVLLFDEIYLNEGLYYNPDTDEIDGYEDYGEGGRTDREANHGLVFMVRGLNSDWKMPIAFDYVADTCPSDMLAQMIPKIIRALNEINIKVLVSVSDQGPTNRGAVQQLRNKCEEGETDPVYIVDGQKIIHLYDIPHLLKSVRNNFLTSDLLFEPGKTAKWSDIIEFFKLDEGICKTSKLNYAHLCPLGRTKMRVDLAAQVFSETTASCMQTFHTLSQGTKLAGCEPTIEIINVLDKLFDSMNGPGRRDAPKVKRINVTTHSYHHQFWRDMIKKLENWVFIRKSTKERHVPPCIQGLIDNLRGLGRLWKNMERLGFTILILRSANQDPIENLFGALRQFCGSNSDPTIPQFNSGLKTGLVQLVTSGRDSNCQSDDTDFLADLEFLVNQATTFTPVSKEFPPLLMRGSRIDSEGLDIPLITKLNRQAPSLTCTTICSKILTVVKRCSSCIRDLTASDVSSDHTLQLLQENTAALDKPSPALVNFYLLCQRKICESWKVTAWKKNVKKEFNQLLQEGDNLFEWLTCLKHSAVVSGLLLNLVVSRVLNLKCSKYNSDLKKRERKTVRQARKTGKTVTIEKDLGMDEIHTNDWTLLTGLPDINSMVAVHLQSKSAETSSLQHLQQAIQQIGVEPIPAEDATQTENVISIDPESLLDEYELLEQFETTVESQLLVGDDVVAASASETVTVTACIQQPCLQPTAQSKVGAPGELEIVSRLRCNAKVTIPELKTFLKSRGVKGYYKFSKKELLEASLKEINK